VKKLVSLTLVTLAIVLMATSPSHARGGHGGGHGHRGFHGRPHGRVFLGLGAGFYAPFYYYRDPFWWDYAYPPVIVHHPPPVYIQKHAEGYWYYCPGAGAYYPTAPTCAEPWVPVPPRSH
jgi:hypothetical protein